MQSMKMLVWKEWREQRTTFLLVLALAALLTLGIGAAFGVGVLRSPWARLLPAIACLITIGGDLLGGPQGSKSVTFVERLPMGLGRTFWAKLLLLIALMVLGTLLGWLITGSISLFHGQTWPWSWDVPALFLVSMSLWCFAVSPWVTRGLLALPVGFVLLAFLGWPVWLLFLDLPWYGMTRTEGGIFLAISVVGSLTVAREGFVHGRSRGGSPGRAARHGLVLATAIFLPFWAWMGAGIYDAFRIEPRAPDFRIKAAAGHKEGTFIYLQTEQESRWKTGSCKSLVRVDTLGGPYTRVGQPGLERHAYRHDRTEGWSVVVDMDGEWRRLGWTSEKLEAVEPPTLRRGHGYSTAVGGERGWFSPYTDRFHSAAEMDLAPGADVLILPCGWLIYGHDEEAWTLLDPASGIRSSLDWPGGSFWLLPEGEVLIRTWSEIADGCRIDFFLGDPENGSLRSLASDFPRQYFTSLSGSRYLGESAPILRSTGSLVTVRYQLLDLDEGRLRTLEIDDGDRLFPIFGSQASVLLVEKEKRLYEMNLHSGERELLFPLD